MSYADVHKCSDGWHIFTGDEIGTILASYVVEEYKKSGKPLSMFIIFFFKKKSSLINEK